VLTNDSISWASGIPGDILPLIDSDVSTAYAMAGVGFRPADQRTVTHGPALETTRGTI